MLQAKPFAEAGRGRKIYVQRFNEVRELLGGDDFSITSHSGKVGDVFLSFDRMIKSGCHDSIVLCVFYRPRTFLPISNAYHFPIHFTLVCRIDTIKRGDGYSGLKSSY